MDAAAQQRAQLGNDAYDGYNHFSTRAAIAILNKNFKLAETIYIEQGQVEEAMQMWKELKQFDKVVQLALARRLPDADEMKSQYLEWLQSEHQEEKAADMYLADGKFKEAVGMYLKGGMPGKAAHVVQEHNLELPKDILEAIAAALAKAQMFERAGQFFEKLSYHERALDAYKKGHSFRPAVELARKEFPAYVKSLEEAWGDYMVSQSLPDQAINHYIEADTYIKAIEAAINARHWAQAVRIVDSLSADDPVTKSFYRLIANHYENARQYAEAEKYYIKAGEREAAVEMYTRTNQWEAAHKVAKAHMTEEEVKNLYITQAKQMEMAGKYKDAERLYLRVEMSEAAVQMYRKAKKYDDMIRLVSTYHKEFLIKTYKTLAATLDREGKYKQAEQYYISAKDWQDAVKMYREANLWDDAVRVARRHGGPNAMKIVIFAWAVHLKGEQGARLLKQHNLVDQAIDYAVESLHFDHAIDLAHQSGGTKVSFVYLKYAMHLEDDGKFKEAEEYFVKANKPKEAIDMYIDQKDWLNAMRVADTYCPSGVADVYEAQAAVALEREDFEHFESYMLKAEKPELVIRAYRDRQKWEEAIRVAKEHCPSKLQEVERDYAHYLAVSDPMAAGRHFEDASEWSKAIDAYLKLDRSNVMNEDELARIWIEKGTGLAASYVKNRLKEVMDQVAQNLKDIDRFKQAAQMFEKEEFYKEAVDCYCDGELWDEARKLADNLQGDFGEQVKKRHWAWINKIGDGWIYVEQGNIPGALDLFERAGQWDDCMKVARKSAPRDLMLNKSAAYIRWLISGRGGKDEEGDFLEGMKVATQDGFDQTLMYFPVYKALFFGKNAVEPDDEDVDEAGRRLHTDICGLWYIPEEVDVSATFNNVKVLYEKLKEGGTSEELSDCERMTMIAYYYASAKQCFENGLPDLGARLLGACARYTGWVPCDKMFYDVGMAFKECGDPGYGPAFVFLSRYLDILDNMEDPDLTSDDLEPWDFNTTDVPEKFPMPLKGKTHITEEAEEEARQWVLTMSLDKDLEKTLPKVKCAKCEEEMCSLSTSCGLCKYKYPTCIITGGPIIDEADKVACKACNSPALRDDWNKYVMKMKVCPWCSNQQSPSY
eukprot:NODE_19_length_3654_cov_89.288766_g15_i0.p1 GENE.NODE_19_length_3654_cov_89.288766_g15_i0~~NODE_19_length_3654_cov_89.288766_g15_i0.p1  ORF type:complete len:1188 (-),score=541.95 NODE_19_length_3654_cov_89.288766_g15_i0:89-3412(-)